MDKELDYGQTEERDRKKARAGKTGTYIFLTFWALVVLFPFYWNAFNLRKKLRFL